MDKNLTQSDLDQFTGTEHYYNDFTGVLYTDGVKYLAEHADAYWLITAIGSHQTSPKLRTESLSQLQFWKLEVKDGKAVLTCREDDGIPPAITQKIPYTDFPLAEINIWVGVHYEEGGRKRMVCYLPGEH